MKKLASSIHKPTPIRSGDGAKSGAAVKHNNLFPSPMRKQLRGSKKSGKV